MTPQRMHDAALVLQQFGEPKLAEELDVLAERLMPNSVYELKPLGTVARMWGTQVPGKFTDSLAQMLVYSQRVLCKPGEFIHYPPSPSYSWHEGARGELVASAIGDWLLQLDTDHVFAPDLLERLLRLRAKYNTRVLSGLYFNKNYPHFPVANTWGESKVNQLMLWDPSQEVLEMGPVGGGCLLVDLDVFREISQKTKEAPFAIRPGLSEDYSFCLRCRECGIPVHLATNVESHHLRPESVIAKRDLDWGWARHVGLDPDNPPKG